MRRRARRSCASTGAGSWWARTTPRRTRNDRDPGGRPCARRAGRAGGRCGAGSAAAGDRLEPVREDVRRPVLRLRRTGRGAVVDRDRVGRAPDDHPARAREGEREARVSATTDRGEPPRRPGELSYGTRKRVFLVAAAGLGVLLIWGLAGLPDFGDYSGVYGETLNRVAVAERHATALVTAVNFDYRGFDTLGEEFILFAAVLGLALLLREQRDEE